MLKEGDKVRVVYSSALIDMKLMFLCGQRGTVVRCHFMNKTPGAEIYIEKGKSAGEEWFVPLQSIQSEFSVDKIRKISMLTSFKV